MAFENRKRANVAGRLPRFVESGRDVVPAQVPVEVPIDQFALESGVKIASRLCILPALFPGPTISVAFYDDRLVVSSAIPRRSLGFWLAPDTPAPSRLDRNERVRLVATIPAHLAPAPMGSAAEFTTTLQRCPSVYTPAIDGIRYRHEYFASGRHSDVEWCNPDQHDHASQHEVIAAYLGLLEAIERARS